LLRAFCRAFCGAGPREPPRSPRKELRTHEGSANLGAKRDFNPSEVFWHRILRPLEIWLECQASDLLLCTTFFPATPVLIRQSWKTVKVKTITKMFIVFGVCAGLLACLVALSLELLPKVDGFVSAPASAARSMRSVSTSSRSHTRAREILANRPLVQRGVTINMQVKTTP